MNKYIEGYNQKTNDPQAAFVAAKADFDHILRRLAAHSENHFGEDPESLTWGKVGDLSRYRKALTELSDLVFGEGEYE